MTASSLHLDDYKRYGRQMILDGIGLPGPSARTSLFFFHQMTLVRVNAHPQVSLSSSRPQWSSSVPVD
jgi:hypothetical protein